MAVVERRQLIAGNGGKLLFRGRHHRVGMRPEKNAPQALLARNPGVVRSIFSSSSRWRRSRSNSSAGKRRVARQISHQLQDAPGEFRESGGRNRAGICAGAGPQSRAHAPQIFLDPAAGARRRAGSHHGGRNLGKSRSGMRNQRIAAPEIKLRGNFQESSAIPPTRPAGRSIVWRRCASATPPRFPDQARADGRGPRRTRPSAHRAPASANGRRTTMARLRRHEIFLREGLYLLRRYAQEAGENLVHPVRVAVEQSEARQQMHQAESRHGISAAFQHRIIIGAEFHLHGIELVEADSLLLQFLDHFVENRYGPFRREFRFVIDARHHLRGAVGFQQVGAAVDVHGDLLVEHQLAIDPSRASAVQHAVDDARDIPIGCFARRHGVANGDGGQRAELFFALPRGALRSVAARSRPRAAAWAAAECLRNISLPAGKLRPARNRRASAARRYSVRSRCGRISARRLDVAASRSAKSP